MIFPIFVRANKEDHPFSIYSQEMIFSDQDTCGITQPCPRPGTIFTSIQNHKDSTFFSSALAHQVAT